MTWTMVYYFTMGWVGGALTQKYFIPWADKHIWRKFW